MIMEELNTLLKLVDLLSMEKGLEKQNNHPFEIGKKYLVRTVTMIQVGRLVAVYPTELVLEDASWIADTGRFSETLKTGEYDEIEPFDKPIIIGRGSIIDATQIDSKLPKERK